MDNNYLRIRNDEGIPYTTGALLLSGTFENAGTAEIKFYENGKSSTYNTYRVGSLVAYQSVVCAAIKAMCDVLGS